MRVLYKMRKIYEQRIVKLRALGIYAGELRNIYNRKNEYSDCKLTREEKKQIDDYYVKYYGKKIPYLWHRLYKSYTGNFDVTYFPEILFSTKLEEKLCPYSLAYPFSNKAVNPQMLMDKHENKGIYVPKIHIINCDDVIWSNNRSVINMENAVKILDSAGEVIIKPTIESMGGRGVNLYNFKDGKDTITNKTVFEVLNEYKKDYIVQERIKNHSSIAKLYNNSINTVRIITYISEEQIKIAPLSLRLGVSGRVVDNNGIFIGITEEGYLNDIGYSKKDKKKYYKHPDTKVEFKGYKIDGVKKMISAAKELHSYLPQFKMLSWDLGYDELDNVVVIEVNTTGQSVWFPQMINGRGIFGGDTPNMLKLISK